LAADWSRRTGDGRGPGRRTRSLSAPRAARVPGSDGRPAGRPEPGPGHQPSQSSWKGSSANAADSPAAASLPPPPPAPSAAAGACTGAGEDEDEDDTAQAAAGPGGAPGRPARRRAPDGLGRLCGAAAASGEGVGEARGGDSASVGPRPRLGRRDAGRPGQGGGGGECTPKPGIMMAAAGGGV
jgi:hypothetical protein